MRAAQMTERPGFTLMTQNDVQNNCYMQMPRWLFSDPRYAVMSLNAKVAYTFLLNRFQLSRMNGWVNDQGEVFVVFPRKELAKELRICEQSVTSAFRELVNLDLVWEKRCGRGEANQIYLAKVNPQSDPNYSCAPFLEMPQDSETEYSSPEDLRTAEIEVLDGNADSDPVLDQSDKQTEKATDNTQEQPEETTIPQEDIPSDAPEMPVTLEKTDTMENPVSETETHSQSGHGMATPTQEPQNLRFKNSGFGGSGTTDFEAQEPQNPRSNKNNISKKEERKNEKSQSFNSAPVCAENAPLSENRESRDFQTDRNRGGRDGQTDSGSELSFILDGCELGSFSPDVALLFENAVERLYYSQSVKIGNAVLPQDRVRSRLYLLDGDILREAERKLSEYGGRRVRNKTGYAMTTIFNCIAEREDYLPRCFGASTNAERRGAPCY